ncbi:MAG: hypothetical protein RLZZ601_667 [Pseudomonadota bacterium]|jgi:hypothetical protein
MLTITQSELLHRIRGFAIGLLAFVQEKPALPILVVKAPKEAILAAKLSSFLKIYVVPVHINGFDSMGLITAFFDDSDEPLIIRSQLFAEDAATESLMATLRASEIDLHFFDEHSREMLAYRSKVLMPKPTALRLNSISLERFDGVNHGAVDDQMQRWFSQRTPVDDESAITVRLGEPLMPEEIVVLNSNAPNHFYRGSPSIILASLEREDPGAPQEHDIALLLGRIFLPEQIIRSPLKVTDNEEAADILVVTKKHLIIIQAKDSPNSANILNNTISRKKATAKKSLRKAVNQLAGTIRYARMQDPMTIVVDNKNLAFGVSGLQWRAIAVVKELFSDNFSEYSRLLLRLNEDTGVPSIALDYAELNMYTANLIDEASFITAIDKVFNHGINTGAFPRLRIF